MVMDDTFGLWESFEAETNAKSTTPKPTHESPIIQVVDINSNATSYAGAVGLRDNDHPKLILIFVLWFSNPYLKVLTSLFYAKWLKRLV